MIKRLSLYGLCFNLGIAVGKPTQTELETFLKALGGKIEVVYQGIGGLSFPDKMTLKDKEAEEAYKTFVSRYGDEWFPEEVEETPDTGEETGLPSEKITPDAVVEDTAASEEVQSLTVPAEGDTREVVAPLEVPSTETEKADDTFMEIYSFPKERTEEELRVCFEQYSRPANAEECALALPWGVENLRIVDFGSIVGGLSDETQKEQAENLIKKENEAKLLEEIDQWVDSRNIKTTYTLKVFSAGNKEPTNFFTYMLNPEIIETFKASLKTTLRGMLRCKSSRETLVLSLVLLKDLKFKIFHKPYCGNNIVGFYVIKCENVNIQVLYHELNHAIHSCLGIEAPGFWAVDNFKSALESNLFRFLYESPTDVELIEIPSLFFHLWICGYWSMDMDMSASVKISQSKYFRELQMSLLWDEPEELWNIIGFCNIGGKVYVNRMSDVNLLQTPRMFHGGCQKFTDPEFLGLNSGEANINLSDWPLVHSFLKEMEDLVKKENISALCPTPEAWAAWLRLQGREDTGIGYFTYFDSSFDKLMEIAKTIDLLKDPSYATVSEIH